ncbi:DMT family transporter [Uliginosibacterium sp. 31-16]|uniref:DMT family transporter n=1 Tax=Uliginosibacterium sp. 31-16 TaxID=3068315 RepID=UPI00273FE78C|nr:DMT family transporter [Uliginosibacterium sp. 31-16]MDP5239093.1 DMT family transporter [Uliginosibacterium sp. 31-16]
MLERFLAPVFVLLWSTGFVGAKYGLPYADALHFLCARYTLVIVLMGLAALIFRAPWPQDGRRVAHIAVAGVLMQATYLGGVFVAIQLGLPAALTALIVGLQPILTALSAGCLLGEVVSRRQWQGLALGFVGVVLVVTNSRAPGLGNPWAWSALWPAVIALLGITLGTLYQKRFCPSFDLRSGAVIQFAASLVVTLPLALHFEPKPIEWSGSFVFALLWLVVMLSVGAVSVLNLLIRRGSAVKVTSLFYLTPAVTALCAWALFDERLGALALLGMALASLGVWLARAR